MKAKNYRHIFVPILLIIILLIFSCKKDNYIPISEIELEYENLILEEGESKEIGYKILPSDATNKNLKWFSNDNKIADVRNGIVFAKGIGHTSILVMSEDNEIKNECTVEVTRKSIPVKSITLSLKDLTMLRGEIQKLSVNINPIDATYNKVTWSSFNTEVANVNQAGEIKALSVGTTYIIVSVDDTTMADTCYLEVTENYDFDGPHITDKTGVASKHKICIYSTGSTHKTYYEDMKLVSGDNKDGIHEATITIAKNELPGNWLVNLYDLEDMLGNQTSGQGIGGYLKIINSN